MSKHRNYEDLGEIELPAVVSARAEAAIVAAERELEEARVNFRWGVAQVAVIKRAAELAGVPYQTYIKQVVFRQAVEDLKDAASIGLVSDERTRGTARRTRRAERLDWDGRSLLLLSTRSAGAGWTGSISLWDATVCTRDASTDQCRASRSSRRSKSNRREDGSNGHRWTVTS